MNLTMPIYKKRFYYDVKRVFKQLKRGLNMKSQKYYTIQNGILTARNNKQLAESIYALDKKASLVEVLPDAVLLYNKSYSTGFVFCNKVFKSVYRV